MVTEDGVKLAWFLILGEGRVSLVGKVVDVIFAFLQFKMPEKKHHSRKIADRSSLPLSTRREDPAVIPGLPLSKGTGL